MIPAAPLSDRVAGIGIALLGAASFLGGSRLPPVPGQDVGPSAFPMVIGAGLVLTGALIAVGIGRGIEAEAEAEVVASDAAKGLDAAADESGSPWRAAIPPALLLGYVAAIDRLGFVPTGAIIVLVMATTLGASLRLAIPLALLAPPAIHLIFFRLLRVPLADGLLPMPW